jgi:uroporphyrinogen-III synthase
LNDSKKRVLLLKSRAASAPLTFLLEEEGLEPVHLPLLEVEWPADPRALRAAAESIARFKWLIVDSPHAVRALSEAVTSAGTLSAVGLCQWLAPDEGTARTITHHGWIPRVVQTEEVACAEHSHAHPHVHSQWAAVAHNLISDDEVLVVHEASGEPEWVGLVREGRGRVTSVGGWVRSVAQPFTGPSPHAIVVDSASAGEVLFERQPGLKAAPLVAVGPATALALKALGAPLVTVAARPTTEAVFEAALVALGGASSQPGWPPG